MNSLLLMQIYTGFHYFYRVIYLLLFAYWILSFFRPQNRLYGTLEYFLSPILKPFRRLNLWLMSKFRSGIMIDFSIWFAMIGLNIVERITLNIFLYLGRLL